MPVPPPGPRVPGELDVVFDLDVGELVPGSHLVLRGIIFGETLDVHYELVPSVTQQDWSRLGLFAFLFELNYGGEPDPGWAGNQDGVLAPPDGSTTQHGVRMFPLPPPRAGLLWFSVGPAPVGLDGPLAPVVGKVMVDLVTDRWWFEPAAGEDGGRPDPGR